MGLGEWTDVAVLDQSLQQYRSDELYTVLLMQREEPTTTERVCVSQDSSARGRPAWCILCDRQSDRGLDRPLQ